MIDPSDLLDDRDFFTRADARAVGLHDRDIAAALRRGEWIRFRRGYYTSPDTWAASSPEQKHLIRSSAVLHSLGPRVALSHVSGALAHGVATWGVPLRRVHVTRLDHGSGRIEGDVEHHVGVAQGRDVHHLDNGLTALSAARCVLESSTLVTPERALVMLDSSLHLGLTTPDELQSAFEQMAQWPGARRLHVPVRLADAGGQSPGESRGRWLFWRHHLPAPQTQYPVHDASGHLLGICDWGWPDLGLLGEFDGRMKYGRLLAEGQDPGDVVFREKQREDAIREATGFAMIRLVWRDLDHPRETATRIAALMRRAA